MDRLLNQVSYAQSDVLAKIVNRSEESQIYLCGFEESAKKNAYGVASVLGTYNKSKKKRESYEVTFYKPGNKVSFWCNCPYHKFKSGKAGTVCKHVCFLVCKVLGKLDASFFDSKKLDAESMSILIEKAKRAAVEVQAPAASAHGKFEMSSKPIDDVCPICYDAMEASTIVSCPRCANHVHDECIRVWLERRETCVYCRSDVWRDYACVK